MNEVLPFELDLEVVEAPAHEHGAIQPQPLGALRLDVAQGAVRDEPSKTRRRLIVGAGERLGMRPARVGSATPRPVSRMQAKRELAPWQSCDMQ